MGVFQSTIGNIFNGVLSLAKGKAGKEIIEKTRDISGDIKEIAQNTDPINQPIRGNQSWTPIPQITTHGRPMTLDERMQAVILSKPLNEYQDNEPSKTNDMEQLSFYNMMDQFNSKNKRQAMDERFILLDEEE